MLAGDVFAKSIKSVLRLLLIAMVAIGLAVGLAPAVHTGPITCKPTSVPVDQLDINSSEAVRIPSVEPHCATYGIPGRLVSGSGGVKLSAFPVKTKTGYRENRGQAWSIDKDTAGHGGVLGS